MVHEARRYLFRRPRALQWFEHGEETSELKKVHEGERASSRFELFLDLLYVALVANFADDFTNAPNGGGLVKYILIFIPAWHAWADAKSIANAYYNDDLLQRVSILWIMSLLVLYGNNAILVEEIDALRATVSVYLVLRATQYIAYALFTFASPYHRIQNRFYAAVGSMALFLYVPLYFESVSLHAKAGVALVAILSEEVIFIFSYGPWLKAMLQLRYSTAVDINHEVDRAAAFYTIVLGEFLYYIIVKSPAAIGLNLSAMRAVWTLVIAFSLNWMYSASDGSIESTHPIRRSVWSAYVWILSHMPLSAGLLIGGHICAVSVANSALSPGLRWMWGGGLGIGLAILFVHALITQSDDPPGLLKFPKALRIAPRLVVALVFVLLPLASEHDLNATQLLSIGAGLFVFLLVWETVGALEKDATVFESWRHPEEEALEIRKSRSGRTQEVDGGTGSGEQGVLPLDKVA